MDTATQASTAMIRSLELSTRGFDLLNTLLQTTGLVAALVELAEWLQMERVPRDSLAQCLRQARGIAYANSSGLAFFERMLSAPSINVNWPLAASAYAMIGSSSLHRKDFY